MTVRDIRRRVWSPSHRDALKRSILVVALALPAASACVQRIPAATRAAVEQSTEALTLAGGRFVELHLSRPIHAAPGRPLVLFATGDGGWHRKDKDAFQHMLPWGYPLAGFSSPEYLEYLDRHKEVTSPAAVARDFEVMIAAAKERLGLAPSTPTILFGVSRGAGLVVAAAGHAAFQPALTGVVAVALTREEEYVHRPVRRRGRATPETEMLDTYGSLARLRDLPLAIVQSTNDEYVTAGEARQLMGPDTPLRRLRPVESKNHSFSDARPALFSEMRAALAWVSEPEAARAGTAP